MVANTRQASRDRLGEIRDMMAITIERQGQRVYLAGDTYAVRDRIKAMGGHVRAEGKGV